jgi:Uma2 family endonuclease
MSEPLIRTRLWSRAEYDRLIELGVLHEDEPIELLDGHLIVAEPKGSPHETAVGLAADALRLAFGPGWLIRIGAPIALDPTSEPEPDICVVRGTWRDYRDAHPSRPALVVEVAESSLTLDRTRKARAYARNGVADYWIVNLIDRVLEVYRDPGSGAIASTQSEYRQIERLAPPTLVSPLAVPQGHIRVADLLP